MPDREHTPYRELERELRDLVSRLEHPSTPDLARAVRDRIDEDETQPSRWVWPDFLRLSPQWAAAAAVLLLVLAVPAFSPAARDTFTGLFTTGGGAAGSGAEPDNGNASPDQSARSSAGAPESAGAGARPSSDLPSSAGGAQSESLPSAAGQAPLPSDEDAGLDFDHKIIKSAQLGIRSKDVRRSAEQAQEVAAQFDGSIQSSRIERGDGPVSADLVLVVPSPEFETALDELRGLGKKVTSDSVSGKDVTEEFVDLESRERNLLAAEQSLLELYNKAENVNSSLSIQRELTNVRGQIEQVQGRMKYLEQRTDSSRIELTIQPVKDKLQSETGWSPLRVAGEAWNASLNVLQTLATTVISIAVFSWWLIPLPLAGFVWWRRRYRTRSNDAPDSTQTPPE
ncbi:hypothetical protein BH23ACT11_BH23ACT11_20790 [soil metagenome]